MNILPDTNILLRSADPHNVDHALAVIAVTTLASGGDTLLLVPQVLHEFWSAATRPPSVNGLGMMPAAADRELTKCLAQFPLLDDLPSQTPVWRRLVVSTPVLGKKAHDACLVAAMQVHNITHVLTFNPSPDFARFPMNTALHPSRV